VALRKVPLALRLSVLAFFGSVASSDAALAPGSSGFMSPGLLEPYLPNSPAKLSRFAPPPIN
jgi:hypothetical protein